MLLPKTILSVQNELKALTSIFVCDRAHQCSLMRARSNVLQSRSDLHSDRAVSHRSHDPHRADCCFQTLESLILQSCSNLFVKASSCQKSFFKLEQIYVLQSELISCCPHNITTEPSSTLSRMLFSHARPSRTVASIDTWSSMNNAAYRIT
jgi:hypothetical protein